MMDADNTLPVIGKLTSIYASSLLIALLTAIVSIAGLLSPHLFYPTEELVQTFVPNDVVDLFIGVPILLGSIWAARRGKLLGLLFWLGALFFGFYNSIAYAFTLPFNWGFLLHLLLVVIDVYTLIALAVSVDGKAIQHQLRDAVYEKINGGVLAGFGFFFFLRVIAISVNALIVGSALTETELAPNISDIFVAPAFIIIGIALWKRLSLIHI